MRRIAILMIVTVSVHAMAFSQFTVGPKVGVNSSKLYHENDFLDTKFGTGFHIGAFVKYDFDSSFSIQPELLFMRQSSTFDIAMMDYVGTVIVDDISVIYDYLFLPVLARYHISYTRLFVEAGPQLGINLRSRYSVKVKDYGIDLNDPGIVDWESMDFSLAGGLGYNFENGLMVSARYCHGLTKVSSTVDQIGHRIRSIQFSLGYYFRSF